MDEFIPNFNEMSNNIIISVIVPVYNVEKYLPYCLKSIQNQTFTDFECILIDDGSTDSSGVFCDQFSKEDYRFKVIHQENTGVSEARNKGIRIASGEYISFIDSDDYIHPQMLEVLYRGISQNPSCTFSMILGEMTNEILINREKINLANAIQYKVSRDFLLKQILGRGKESSYQYDVIWNKLYPTKILKNKRFINEGYSEDTEFNSRIYLETQEAVLIPVNLYYYVQRQSSVTHQFGIKFIKRIVVFYYIYQNISLQDKYYKAWALEKIYKTILNVRYHTSGGQYVYFAKETIKNIKERTFILFLRNKKIPFFRKYGILILYYIKPLYNFLIWYNNRR